MHAPVAATIGDGDGVGGVADEQRGERRRCADCGARLKGVDGVLGEHDDELEQRAAAAQKAGRGALLRLFERERRVLLGGHDRVPDGGVGLLQLDLLHVAHSTVARVIAVKNRDAQMASRYCSTDPSASSMPCKA